MVDLSSAFVFFDFDGTVTVKDVVDSLIDAFSKDRDYTDKIELMWKQGRIGSRECLSRQIAVLRTDELTLIDFLSTIEIDPHFPAMVNFLKKSDIPFAIISDGFDFIIRSILSRNGFFDIRIYSNSMVFDNNAIRLEFGLFNSKCGRCGHCKSNTIKLHKDSGRKLIYIGDGLSDLCPASKVDMLFAKGDLLRHCREKGIGCVEFNNLSDIFNIFSKSAIKKRKTVSFIKG